MLQNSSPGKRSPTHATPSVQTELLTAGPNSSPSASSCSTARYLDEPVPQPLGAGGNPVQAQPARIERLSGGGATAGSPLAGGAVWQRSIPVATDLQNNATTIPLDKVFVKQRIDLMTARAWLTQEQHLEQQVIDLSLKPELREEMKRVMKDDAGDMEVDDEPEPDRPVGGWAGVPTSS